MIPNALFLIHFYFDYSSLPSFLTSSNPIMKVMQLMIMLINVRSEALISASITIGVAHISANIAEYIYEGIFWNSLFSIRAIKNPPAAKPRPIGITASSKSITAGISRLATAVTNPLVVDSSSLYNPRVIRIMVPDNPGMIIVAAIIMPMIRNRMMDPAPL